VTLEIVHAADYSFPAATAGLELVLRLDPAAWERPRSGAFALSVVPPPAASLAGRDRWGNAVRRLRFNRPLRRVSVSAHVRIEGPRALPDDPPGPADRLVSPGIPLAAPAGARPADALAHAAETCARLREGWRFEPRPAAERPSLPSLLDERRGQCLELARLLVWQLRALGHPARHVLGHALATPQRVTVRQRHAWVAVHDGAGWREVDPTAPDRPAEALFATAWGPALGMLMPVRARHPALLADVRAAFSTQVTGMPSPAGAGGRP
jgi:transglutaminase-like putative cysteine protease